MRAVDGPRRLSDGLVLAGMWASLAVLVVLGVFRPQLPALVRVHWTAGVAWSGLVGAVLVFSRLRQRKDPQRGVLFAVFFLTLAILYLQPQRVASDGIFYFAPLHSLVVDQDLDFANEYRVLGAPEGYFQPTRTGRLPNNFSIGPALLWAPFYLLVHGVALLGLFRPTGFGYPYFTAVATTTAAFGFLGVLWLYELVRGYFDPSVACLAAVLLWLGSFHFWYMAFEPSMSHAPAMAAVCGYLLLCYRGPKTTAGFLLAGAAAGLVVLMRWQNIFFLPVGIVLIVNGRLRPGMKQLGLMVAAAAAMFLPQMLYWRSLYGHFLLIPQGGNYLRWSHPQFEAVLFSSRHGLMSWSPVLWMGAFGLPVFLQRARRFGLAYLAAFGLSLYINAAVWDWWAGASFGARRFDASLPLFGLGLAGAIDWALAWTRRHAFAAVVLVLSAFVAWNLMLVGTYALGGIPFDDAVSFRQVASDGLELIYRRTGYPFSWPAALAERIRSGRPLAAYDLAGALHPSNNVEIRMGDTDALYLGPGWSLPRRRRGRTYREASGEGAMLYFALREPAAYRLVVKGRSPGVVEVWWNGRPVGRIRLTETRGAVVDLWPKLVKEGMNELRLRPADGRGFAVARVTLRRAGTP